jgi:predicted Zn-dependent protease
MRVRDRLLPGCLAMPLILALIACSAAQRVRTETTLARVLISDEQSQQIGAQVHAGLEEKGMRTISDPVVTDYVRGIARTIFSQAAGDRPGVEFQLDVIDDPKSVNAFAIPGGRIYVYSGLLIEAENEAEVAGVLAHETGHVVGRHIERAMVNAYGLQALAGLALGRDPSLAAEVVTGFVAQGVLLAHGRSEETEADEYGARYAARAGYDPRALITFFQKLEAREGGGSGGAMKWLRSHPLTTDRIAHLNRYIGERRLSGSTLGARRHREIRDRLAGSR